MPYTVSKNVFPNTKMEFQTHKTSENDAYLNFNYPIRLLIYKEAGSRERCMRNTDSWHPLIKESGTSMLKEYRLYKRLPSTSILLDAVVN